MNGSRHELRGGSRRGEAEIVSAFDVNTVRLAEAHDAEGILRIYAPIVWDTAISFEVEPPTTEEMRARIEAALPEFAWLVSESDGGIAGYAYASRHRERAAYRWSVDVSVYVTAGRRREGVARGLYTPLLGILEDLGYYSAFAGIALPNAASVGFHESMGFRPIGIYRKVGYKLGAWHDVGWWQRALREYGPEPRPPRSMQGYRESDAWHRRLGGQAPAG
jgi:L-amino acid N-acyltransferase YncA